MTNLNLFAILLLSSVAHAADQSTPMVPPSEMNRPVQGNSSGLTLEQAITEAESNSPRLKQANAAAGESYWRVWEAANPYIPKVSFGGYHYFSQLPLSFSAPPTLSPSGAFPLAQPYTILALQGSVTVFDGLMGVEQIRAASKNQEAAQEDLGWVKFQLDEDIRLKYFQALGAKELAGVAEQNIKTLEDHLQKTQTQLDSGSATQFDVLRVEVQLNEARSEKLSADDNVILARMRLTESMGMKDDVRILNGALPIPDASAAKNEILPETVQRPDIHSRELMAEAADLRATATKLAWVPQVGIQAQTQIYSGGTFPPTANDTLNPNSFFPVSYNFGLTFSWNIWDGGASLARAREAEFQREQADAAVEMAHNHLPVDLALWRRRLVYSTALFEARKTDVSKSEESVRLAKEGLHAGTRTTSEVLDAELDLFRSKAGVIRAQLDALEATVNLELALGRKS